MNVSIEVNKYGNSTLFDTISNIRGSITSIQPYYRGLLMGAEMQNGNSVTILLLIPSLSNCLKRIQKLTS